MLRLDHLVHGKNQIRTSKMYELDMKKSCMRFNW